MYNCCCRRAHILGSRVSLLAVGPHHRQQQRTAALPVICSVGDSDVAYLGKRAETALERLKADGGLPQIFCADAKRCPLVRTTRDRDCTYHTFSGLFVSGVKMQPRLDKCNGACHVLAPFCFSCGSVQHEQEYLRSHSSMCL